MSDRIILHCDCNSFYASCEEALNPSLKQFPVAVCGNPKSRHGIILAKNQKAKEMGVKTAETLWQAKEKCPNLVAVPPHHDEYLKMHKKLNGVYLTKTDLVEPFGIDESFLDITNSVHLFGTAKEVADSLRKEIRENFKITISVGVSFNKAFAKLGSDYKKPDATTVITRENMKEIVWTLPCHDLLYVGRQAEQKLLEAGIKTIGDIASCDRDFIMKLLGKQGEMLRIYALGEDNSPVRSYYDIPKPKSVGNGMTFRRNLYGEEDIKVGAYLLSGEVAMRLKEAGLFAGGINVTVKTPDFKVQSHQISLDNPTDSEFTIGREAFRILKEKGCDKKLIRSITVTAINLTDEEMGQLSLFGNEKEDLKQKKLENALTGLKKKMGMDIIGSGAFLGTDLFKEEEEEQF